MMRYAIAVALTLASSLVSAQDFTGIKKPSWNWKAAGATYGAIIAADYALTIRCERAGTCVEGNTHASKPVLAAGAFAAAMISDRLMHWIHPKAPRFLRLGFGVHRGLAQMKIDVTL